MKKEKIECAQIYHEGPSLHFLHTESAVALGLAGPGGARRRQCTAEVTLHFTLTNDPLVPRSWIKNTARPRNQRTGLR